MNSISSIWNWLSVVLVQSRMGIKEWEIRTGGRSFSSLLISSLDALRLVWNMKIEYIDCFFGIIHKTWCHDHTNYPFFSHLMTRCIWFAYYSDGDCHTDTIILSTITARWLVALCHFSCDVWKESNVLWHFQAKFIKCSSELFHGLWGDFDG